MTMKMKSKDSKQARERIKNWCEQARATNDPCCNASITAFTNWEELIANSFDYNYTNAFVEGKHNKFKILKRNCCGIRNAKNLRNRIIANNLKLKVA